MRSATLGPGRRAGRVAFGSRRARRCSTTRSRSTARGRADDPRRRASIAAPRLVAGSPAARRARALLDRQPRLPRAPRPGTRLPGVRVGARHDHAGGSRTAGTRFVDDRRADRRRDVCRRARPSREELTGESGARLLRRRVARRIDPNYDWRSRRDASERRRPSTGHARAVHRAPARPPAFFDGPGGTQVPDVGDRRDRRLSPRVEREPRRAVRDARAGPTCWSRTRADSRAAPRRTADEVAFGRQHDDAQLRAVAHRVEREWRGRRRDRLHEARSRRERLAVARARV